MTVKNSKNHNKNTSNTNIISGVIMIVASLILGLYLTIGGCSGGHKMLPTDPAASKATPTDQIGTTTSGTETPTDRTVGIGTPGAGVDIKNLAIMQQLADVGGGQGGRIFEKDLLVGVFDAYTSQPIEGAVIGIGNTGSLCGQTNTSGWAFFIDVIKSLPPATMDKDLYISAAAEGYNMTSYNYISNEVIVFMLEPNGQVYNPPDASIHGTFTVDTDNYLFEIVATNVIEYVDNIVAPSEPGDHSDTFMITVEAGKVINVLIVQKNPVTGAILGYENMPLSILEEGQSIVMDRNFYSNGIGDGTISDGRFINMKDYSVQAIDYTGNVYFPDGWGDHIVNFDLEIMIDADNIGYYPVTDVIAWTNPPVMTNEGRKFIVRYSPVMLTDLMYQAKFQAWFDVVYDDKSHSSFPIDMGRKLREDELNIFIFAPPLVHEPSDGDVGVTVNPVLTWTGPREFSTDRIIVKLRDIVNGQEWKIFVRNNVDTTQLPILPTSLVRWGLTVGNQVTMTVENDLHFTIIADQSQLRTWLYENNLKPVNVSAPVTFTP